MVCKSCPPGWNRVDELEGSPPPLVSSVFTDLELIAEVQLGTR